MGIIKVQHESLGEDVLFSPREIKEVVIPNRSKPYFQTIENEPLTFSMVLYFKEGYDREDLRKVARWLYQDYYKPLYFEEEPSKIYYALLNGESSITFNGAGEGYLEIEVRCDSPYPYTPVYTKNNLEFLETDNINFINHDNYNNVSGDYDNIKIENGTLKIDVMKTKWMDIDPNTKWGDLD